MPTVHTREELNFHYHFDKQISTSLIKTIIQKIITCMADYTYHIDLK